MLSNRSSSRVAATNKFRPDAKSCLATLHNRNDMANLFTASSWNQLYPGIKILKVMLEVLDTSWTSSFWLTGTLTPITSPDQMSRRYCNLCELRWYSACLAPRQLSKQEDSETLLNVKTANRHGWEGTRCAIFGSSFEPFGSKAHQRAVGATNRLGRMRYRREVVSNLSLLSSVTFLEEKF